MIDPSINSGFAFSGDGSKIYFQNRSNMYLSRINRDGTGLTAIGDNPLSYYVLGMELSLDKDKMLLAGGDFNIYHINDNTISVLDFNPLYYTYKTAYWTSDNRIVCTNKGTSDADYCLVAACRDGLSYFHCIKKI